MLCHASCSTCRGHTDIPLLATSRVLFLHIPFLYIPTCLVNPQSDPGGYWSHHKGWTSHIKESPVQLRGAPAFGWVWLRGQQGSPGSSTEFGRGSPALPKLQDVCRHPDNSFWGVEPAHAFPGHMLQLVPPALWGALGMCFSPGPQQPADFLLPTATLPRREVEIFQGVLLPGNAPLGGTDGPPPW